MTLFDAEWMAKFGPIGAIPQWTAEEQQWHLDELEFELASLPVPLDVLIARAPQTRPDRRLKLGSRNGRMLALIEVRRAAQRRKSNRDKKMRAFEWMRARGWRAEDICARLRLTQFEYDDMLREAS